MNIGPGGSDNQVRFYLTVHRRIEQDDEVVLFKPADPVPVPTSNFQPPIADRKVIQVSLVAVLTIRQRRKPVVDRVTVAGRIIRVATQYLEPLVKVERGQVKVHTKAGLPSTNDMAVYTSHVRPVGTC